MPELPEVQTIINFLNKNINNIEITNVFVKNKKFLKNINENDFENKIKNSHFKNIYRIGKYLIFDLSNNLKMVVHLRMEGKFFIDENNLEKRKHDYIIFELKNKKFLCYNDSRQFGTFHVVDELDNLKEIKKIAIDPLDEKFDFDFLNSKINKSKKNIKSLLLEQTIVSGIGNIYASEILFDCKINPFLRGCDLKVTDIKNIVKSSKKILNLAIENHGTTIHSYKVSKNEKGNFQQFLKVVSRENKKCFNCNNLIKRIKQQSRSTFYCSNCQNVN